MQSMLSSSVNLDVEQTKSIKQHREKKKEKKRKRGVEVPCEQESRSE